MRRAALDAGSCSCLHPPSASSGGGHGSLASHIGSRIHEPPKLVEPFGEHGGLVEVYRAKDALDAAIDYFRALTISYPKNANALSGLGWSYAQSFQFDEAIRSFTSALEINPDLTQANHGLVRSYFRTGRYQKSLESCLALQRAAERRGDFEMLAYAAMMQGTIASYWGDYLKALDYLHESINLAKEIGDRSREASSVNNAAAGIFPG